MLIQAQDGLIYENPVILRKGIQFDGRNPPLVFSKLGLKASLEALGIEGNPISRGMKAECVFQETLEECKSWHINLKKPIPIPDRYDAVLQFANWNEGKIFWADFEIEEWTKLVLGETLCARIPFYPGKELLKRSSMVLDNRGQYTGMVRVCLSNS